jgi:hypothetical protein
VIFPQIAVEKHTSVSQAIRPSDKTTRGSERPSMNGRRRCNLFSNWLCCSSKNNMSSRGKLGFGVVFLFWCEAQSFAGSRKD